MEFEEILAKYRGLRVVTDDTLEGWIEVDTNDVYEVRIEFEGWPKRFPIVKEIGERIPSKDDRHKYENTDICCLTTKAKECILLKKEIFSTIDFMDRIVVSFFKNNSYYEINRKYVQGDHAHGPLGILEGYQDILGIKSIELIIELIAHKINGRKLTIRDLCYCQSGLKFKHCQHSSNYRDFRLIETEILQQDLGHLKNLYEILLDLKREKDQKNVIPSPRVFF